MIAVYGTGIMATPVCGTGIRIAVCATGNVSDSGLWDRYYPRLPVS
ncbi:MAG: hypothetical protein KJ900_12165 [Proteobacteria bacterium]|nr:hypothetical protein [Pseudomonadota bacterium]MCG2744412.1 hypothetical protein [Desulfobacteraceae bacterium]MBU4028469.1 hypothetical protein [Pseudomonadota bacterium]MBU4043631.1 hypothetical protein [Pseudomonadota bacterium]MBU4166888.1 hypothetical protein [Pseudomonadota bacterium]